MQTSQVSSFFLRRSFPWELRRCEASQGAGRERDLKTEVILGLVM